MTKSTTLVLGGINSGKSAFAESLVNRHATTPYYIATSAVLDCETQEKIVAHKKMRGNNWHTIEETLHIGNALARIPAGSFVLVDCLTMWLNNLMFHQLNTEECVHQLFQSLAQCDLDVTFVSNEIGLGGISENALTRKFARLQGSLNQSVAKEADHVAFIAAGLPIWLKGGI